MLNKALITLVIVSVMLITGCGRSITLKTDNVTIIHNDDQTLLSDGDNELMIAGASGTAQTLVVPYNGESAITAVMRDKRDGSVIDADDGTDDAAWDDGEIEATQQAVSNDWLLSIPASNVKIVYITLYSVAAASVDKTTIPYNYQGTAFLLDTRYGSTGTDTNFNINGQIRVRDN